MHKHTYLYAHTGMHKSIHFGRTNNNEPTNTFGFVFCLYLAVAGARNLNIKCLHYYEKPQDLSKKAALRSDTESEYCG